MGERLMSLKTRTPEEGFKLAISLAQKAVPIIQPSEQIRRKLRPKYSKDPDSIMLATHVIAIHFQTIAAANNYWK